MWPDSRLTDLLGIEHPIIQAPMLASDSPELAAAVGAAGGLGSIGCGRKSADEVAALHSAVGQLTNAPVNFNFFVDAPAQDTPYELSARVRAALALQYSAVGAGSRPDLPDATTSWINEAMVAQLEELKPRVVSFHFGVPEVWAMGRLKAAGILILSTATTVAEAKALQEAGVDAIIAQGWEAGGHRGSHQPTLPREGVGTMALVPQVVDAVTVPVIAAGGIADGRGIAAAFALGASGVQMGTAFLRTTEAATPEARRAKMANASDAGTMMTDAVSGRVARASISPYAVAMEDFAGELPPFPSMYALSGPVLTASAEKGADHASFDLWGQAAPLARDTDARSLFDSLVSQALERMPKP